MIVTWNSGAVIGSCLDALAEHPPAGGLEALVIDNASSDDTVARARVHPLGPAVVANPSNRGLAAANNQGIEASSASFILLANPDTKVAAGAIDALVDLLERRPRAAFAVPRLNDPGGGLQASVGDLPSLREALVGRRALARAGGDAGFWWDGWAHDEERRIGRGQEACYLVRREAVRDFGLQDERFFLDWEGVDWAARAGRAGWEIWFTPEARVEHAGGASIRRAPARWIVGSHRGMYLYFGKRSRPIFRPLLATLIAARGLLKAAAALVGLVRYGRPGGS